MMNKKEKLKFSELKYYGTVDYLLNQRNTIEQSEEIHEDFNEISTDDLIGYMQNFDEMTIMSSGVNHDFDTEYGYFVISALSGDIDDSWKFIITVYEYLYRKNKNEWLRYNYNQGLFTYCLMLKEKDFLEIYDIIKNNLSDDNILNIEEKFLEKFHETLFEDFPTNKRNLLKLTNDFLDNIEDSILNVNEREILISDMINGFTSKSIFDKVNESITKEEYDEIINHILKTHDNVDSEMIYDNFFFDSTEKLKDLIRDYTRYAPIMSSGKNHDFDFEYGYFYSKLYLDEDLTDMESFMETVYKYLYKKSEDVWIRYKKDEKNLVYSIILKKEDFLEIYDIIEDYVDGKKDNFYKDEDSLFSDMDEKVTKEDYDKVFKLILKHADKIERPEKVHETYGEYTLEELTEAMKKIDTDMYILTSGVDYNFNIEYGNYFIGIETDETLKEMKKLTGLIYEYLYRKHGTVWLRYNDDQKENQYSIILKGEDFMEIHEIIEENVLDLTLDPILIEDSVPETKQKTLDEYLNI